MHLDLRLYLVTDQTLCLPRHLEDVILAAVKGGVTIVQLREKSCSTREYVEIAKRVKVILAGYNVPLIINDRLDVALASDADGIHLGSSDLSYKDALKFLGSDKIIGVSASCIENAVTLNDVDLSYIAIGPVFETQTKKDAGPLWGVEGLKVIRQLSRHKLVAIGGINSSNIENVVKCGVDGVAVVSAICSQDNPKSASRDLRASIDRSKFLHFEGRK